MRRAILAALLPVALLALFFPRRARADAPDGGGALAAAQADFAAELAASATADCGTACRALDSLRRAADNLCTLDPGPPCADAKAKLEKASERVHASCPDCPAMAFDNTPKPPPPPALPPQETKSPSSVPATENLEETTVAAAPRRSGGCASCSVSNETRDPTPALAIAALATLLLRKRRRV